MATIVYIDGFNLYYGALKGTPYKWLDLEALSRRLLPNERIVQIRYFTAKVSARDDDLLQPERQLMYLRALSASPTVTVHLGHYRTRRVRMRLTDPPRRGPKTVEVFKSEEKGSDVNLATYLLLDGFQARCDTAVVVSNDSDLTEPIRVAQKELGLRVGVVNPHPPSYRSRLLRGKLLQAAAPVDTPGMPAAVTCPRRPREGDPQAVYLVTPRKRRDPPQKRWVSHPAARGARGDNLHLKCSTNDAEPAAPTGQDFQHRRPG